VCLDEKAITSSDHSTRESVIRVQNTPNLSDRLEKLLPSVPTPSSGNLPNSIWVRTITSAEGETTTTLKLDHPAIEFGNGIEVTTTTVKTATEVTTTTVTSLLPMAGVRAMDDDNMHIEVGGRDGKDSETGKEQETNNGTCFGSLEG
jgi:hypothetical protein